MVVSPSRPPPAYRIGRRLSMQKAEAATEEHPQITRIERGVLARRQVAARAMRKLDLADETPHS